MSDYIPLSIPLIKGNEWVYIKECLDTSWVSSAGKFVDRFEQEVARYLNRKFAIACVNGTSALHIALLLSGLKADEEVIMPALTFVAPANAVRYVGAWPVFIDVDSLYWQIDLNKLREFLKTQCVRNAHGLINKRTGRIVRVILCVHLLGHPVDIDSLYEIAQEFGLKVVEDMAESLGATYRDQPLGSRGELVCLSFNGNKVVTCGGGGMIITDNEEYAQRAKYLTTQAKDDSEEFVHHEVGYNYRLTNIQAAIGVAQMEKLDEFVMRKKEIAEEYKKNLIHIPGFSWQQQASWAQSTSWLFTALVQPSKNGLTSRSLIKYLKTRRIEARPLWHPLHSLRPFERSDRFQVEIAEDLYSKAVSLPSSVGLSADQHRRVIEVIKEAVNDKFI